MRTVLTLILLAAFSLWLPLPAKAILIETGAKQRVAGFLVREDVNQIVIRIKQPDGKDKVQTFDTSRVKVLHKVDRARLEKLSKDNPNAYREYAEELALKTADPEAIELAMRLYVISAYLDPVKLGRSSLLNMSALATHPADVRKYRAMAFLLDAKSDAGLLKVELTPKKVSAKAVKSVATESKESLKVLTRFQKALVLYRTGKINEAKSTANEKGVGDYFAKAGIKDQKTFLQACSDANCTKCKAGAATCTACEGKKFTDPTGTGMFNQACTECNGKGTQKCKACDGFGHNPIPDEYLRSILRAEIWAIDQMISAEPAESKSSAGGWSGAVSNPRPSIPLLTLETVTEFDPRRCVFRKGMWEAP